MISGILVNDPSYKDHIDNELEIHKSLHHPNIVEFIESFVIDSNLYIIQSLCVNRSLRDLLKKRHSVTYDECRYFIDQILKGVGYMHDNGIIHRDLKLTNILLDDELRIKIADFGLSIRMDNPNLKLKHICGTTDYLPPEVLQHKGFTPAADIWAIGVITYTLLNASHPFSIGDSDCIKEQIKRIDYKLEIQHKISFKFNFL